MGAGSFREASRKGISDDLGYATQLSVYRDSLGCMPAVWVVEDKASSRVKLIPGLEGEALREKLDRAQSIIETLRELEEVLRTSGFNAGLEFLVSNVGAPQPRTFRGIEYLPWSMSYSPFREALYDYTQEDGKQPVFYGYIEDVDEVREILEELLEDGLIQWQQHPSS